MAVNLADKRTESKVITVMWGDDPVEVSYFPNAVTPNLLDEVEAAAKQDDLSVIGTLLEPVLDWWDVLDDKGKRIPTDKATISGLPLRWLTLVQKALEDDQRPPDSADPKGSAAG